MWIDILFNISLLNITVILPFKVKLTTLRQFNFTNFNLAQNSQSKLPTKFAEIEACTTWEAPIHAQFAISFDFLFYCVMWRKTT